MRRPSLRFPKNDVVIRDNAEILIPEAVAYTEGLLNHFFRGRLHVDQDPDQPRQLRITNVSDTSVLTDPSQSLTFHTGQFHLYYQAVDQQHLHPVPGGTIALADLLQANGVTSFDVGEALPCPLIFSIWMPPWIR